MAKHAADLGPSSATFAIVFVLVGFALAAAGFGLRNLVATFGATSATATGSAARPWTLNAALALFWFEAAWSVTGWALAGATFGATVWQCLCYVVPTFALWIADRWGRRLAIALAVYNVLQLILITEIVILRPAIPPGAGPAIPAGWAIPVNGWLLLVGWWALALTPLALLLSPSARAWSAGAPRRSTLETFSE